MTSIELNPSVLEKSYRQEDWQRGYRSLAQEFDYWIDDIDGEIPAELQGTLFRNGPGLLEVNGERIHHPFDGDGMICAIAFQNGRAHFRNRFVKTAGYLAEQEAGKILYRGVFGTNKSGGWLANLLDVRLKNIANTNILYWGGKLRALWEAAEPHALDPRTLDTLGLDNLEGVLKPGDAFAAHPRIDPDCAHDGDACLVNFSIKPGLSSTITLYEFGTNGKLLRKYAHATPGFAFIHDFAITPHYCILFQNPVTFNPLNFLAGVRSAAECIQFHPNKPTKIVVIPRKNSGSQETAQQIALPTSRTFETLSGFVFHHANAFEQGDEVVIDSVCYEDLPAVEPGGDFRQTNFDAIAPGQLWRFQVNLQTGTVDRQLLEGRCCEFPVVHPAKVGRSYRYAYLAAGYAPTGNAPLQTVVKVDTQSSNRALWSAAPWGYVGEPIFVPRNQSNQPTNAEDDGWVLVMTFDASRDRSDLVILDAHNLSEVARLHLKHHVPYGLHGSFTSECFM
ncbi:carotenoid oxygenase family protein [Phormidium sp. CLA17]|uniref:carotenoid oxygenase family protein n=1 Tax=Leptolyngbya sp. Cla-17 TaxID=2803751 RepID=UPI0014917735|nr:carotenoid oxygenase family protein [Leptolyngbya sp. Cla-17]MBM0740653.1 carotenoid oxygenase family protein [Leptolyngbya sp. Cla-17]